MFHHRGYIPGYFYPFGEDLRLTIYSAAERQRQAAPDANRSDEPHALDTVGDMFAALRGCWVPPDGDGVRPGMEMTVRFAFNRNGEMVAPPRITYATRGASPETRDVYFKAIMATLQRCTPLPLSAGLAGEIVGIPIAVRFVDDRHMRG
jgi:hypothetical protein